MISPSTAPSHTEYFHAREHRLPLTERPLVMGVLNVTPDSFWDGGYFLDPESAVERALHMVEEGADLLDIGAESSRPGALPIPENEEVRRLLPVLTQICQKISVPVSVDTTKAGVARIVLNEGASLINDISALRFDPFMGPTVAEYGAGVILMHMQGTPSTMQQNPQYRDVVGEVKGFLSDRLQIATQAGISVKQILLDPGFGFGKTVEHNLALLSQLDSLMSLGRPLVVGLSRKAFIGAVLRREVSQRLMGTAAAVAMAVQRGARVIRVHDVEPMVEVVRMVAAIEKNKSATPPSATSNLSDCLSME